MSRVTKYENISKSLQNSRPRVEKEPEFKGETVDEVSDVSSNELSGPEDGECESGNGKFLHLKGLTCSLLFS